MLSDVCYGEHFKISRPMQPATKDCEDLTRRISGLLISVTFKRINKIPLEFAEYDINISKGQKSGECDAIISKIM